MIGEFDLPEEIVDRKVTKMKMISPSNREVDVGRTLSEKGVHRDVPTGGHGQLPQGAGQQGWRKAHQRPLHALGTGGLLISHCRGCSTFVSTAVGSTGAVSAALHAFGR